MKFRYILLGLALAAVASQALSEVLTLDECLGMAMENNPGLKGARKELDISEALAGSYLDIPNTGIELTQSTIEGAGMDNGLTFSQEFEFPTVYIARRKVSNAERQLRQIEYSKAVSELRGEVCSIYFSLMYQNAKLRLLHNDYTSYEDFARISEVRFEEGESSRLECLNARRMKARIEARIEDTRLAIEGLRLQLARALGLETPADIATNDIYLLEMEETLAEFNASATQDSRIGNARITISEKNEWLARQEFLPGLSVSATSQLVIKGFNPYHVERERFAKGDFMGFSVGITVPLFFGAKRSRLMAARREIELGRLRLEEGMQRQSMEFENLRNELLLSKKRLDYYTGEALAQAQDFRSLASISYQLGEIGYLEYMENIESSTEIWLEYLETLDRCNQSVIKIQTLKGEI